MTWISSFWVIALVSTLLVCAAPLNSRSLSKQQSCTGTINSINDVKAATQCTNVVINSFTVPGGNYVVVCAMLHTTYVNKHPGKTFKLALLDGTTVNLQGDITFGNQSFSGPLFQISGKSITFNGNGYKLDGGGPYYWDGQGNSGTQKPTPMIKIGISGTFINTQVVNSPSRAISVSNPAPLTISDVTIDNSQGDQPNAHSNGRRAGKNTDGFDISANNLTIQNCKVMNQDDCVAINKGTNIVLKNNICLNGHGISIGSIGSDTTVRGVTIQGNNISNSDQALRIKTVKSASGSVVSDVTYSGNTGSNLKRFGVLVDQSYPSTLGTPGNGVTIENIKFTGATNTLSVQDSAIPVAVNCGLGRCIDTWDWTSLRTTGGVQVYTVNSPQLTGYND